MDYVAQQISSLVNSDDSGVRYDANDTAILSRKLESVKAKTYDVKYPTLKARQYIPVSSSVDPAAETIVYAQWDSFGMAKLISNYADDLPLVDIAAREFRTPVKSLGDAYQYSIMDLRRASLANVSLDQKRADMARRAIEAAIDHIAVYGRPEVGLPGFVNHANVPMYAVPNAQWASASRNADQILADVNAFVGGVELAGKEVFVPDTLLLPTMAYKKLKETYVSVGGQYVSLLQLVKDANENLTLIDRWYRLDSVAGATGGNRAVCYARDPEVLELEVPQEFEQFEAQRENLALKVPCHARVGGVSVRYPVAMGYADNLA